MKTLTIDLTSNILEDLNISIDDLLKYKYTRCEKKPLTKAERNKKYYEKRKEEIKAKNRQKAREYYYNKKAKNNN